MASKSYCVHTWACCGQHPHTSKGSDSLILNKAGTDVAQDERAEGGRKGRWREHKRVSALFLKQGEPQPSRESSSRPSYRGINPQYQQHPAEVQCACVYSCTGVCMCASKYVCACTYVHVYVLYVCACESMSVFTCKYVYVYVFMCVSILVYVYVSV